MSYHITHRLGNMESNPPLARLAGLYAELEEKDEEHPDVSVTHESEWCLTAFPTGTLIWENLEGGQPPKQMKRVPREKVLELWRKLSKGEIAAIDSEAWEQGYQ